ncbi:hypothetical protein BGZ76_011619 [Entomortierella beljakovae]|nr:hypothetical protein BGZ76_011619 [Entomortierella beljakovae]
MSVKVSTPIEKSTPSSYVSTPNSTSLNTPNTTEAIPDINSRPDLQCPECRSCNVFEEYEDGEIICRDCGHVFEDLILTNPDSYETTNAQHSLNQEPIDRFRHHVTYQSTESRRQYRAKRFEQIRQYLATSARQCGLTSNQANRAFYLWKEIMDHFGLRFWEAAATGAIACLYLAAKESKKGVSLVDLAARADISPYKIGAQYKSIKSGLLELEVFSADQDIFHSEEDLWVILQRILTITSSDVMPRSDLEILSPNFRKVLGVVIKTTEIKASAANLRILLSSAQKCLTIAKDSGLLTGRQPQSLVAACLVIAIEVRLEVYPCPDEVFEFTSKLFSTKTSTIRKRYRELRQCMLAWALRLPFVKGVKIKDSKLAFYMDDVLKYFGHLEEQNKKLWEALDNNEGAEDDKTCDNEDLRDQLGPGGHITEQDLRIEQQLIHEENLWELDGDGTGDDREHKTHKSKSNQSSIPARLYPPSYVRNLEREKRQLANIKKAKSMIGCDETSLPIENGGRQNDVLDHDKIGKIRVEWIKQLLVLGIRTEQELLEATDGMLEYWVRSDLAKKSETNKIRTKEQMDSTQLTSDDLDENEMAMYLREFSGEENSLMLRIMEDAYSHKKGLQEPKIGRKRARMEKETESSERKKVRSSKLNLEALEELDLENAESINVR